MLERVRLRGRVDHSLGKRRRACAATLEALVRLGCVSAVLDGEAAHELDLLVGVAGEAVHGDDRLQPEAGDDVEMPREVRGPAVDRVEPSVRVAAVVLERARRRDEHDRARTELADPADDVEELLHAHVRAEAALGDDVVAELERDAVGDERVVAVGDVRERTAMDERRLPLERLDEIRLERVLQQHGHRACGPQLLRRHGLALVALRDRDRAQP